MFSFRSGGLAAALLFCVQPASADELRFQALWHEGTGTNLATPPESRADFLDRGARMTAAGQRLVDFETAIVDGARVYSGIWIDGGGANLFAGPMGPVDLREAMEARRAQGLRVVDFEIARRANGGRLYWAVWRPGSGTERITRPVPLDEFLALGERLTTQEDLRLTDVEGETINGQILYSGLWRTGSGTNLFTGPRRPAPFRALRNEMRADGLELVDFERVGGPGNRRFVGVFAPGDGEGVITVPRDFAAFSEVGAGQAAQGRRTRDMEMLVIGPASPPPPDPQPDPVPPGPTATDAGLPDLPPWIQLTDNSALRIEWGVMVETEAGGEVPRMTVPRHALPDHLPLKNNEQDVVFPQLFCGMNITMVNSISWQRNGQIVDQPPFNHVPSVADIEFDPEFGNQNFMQAGIEFSGPIGGCEGSNHGWDFPIPITQTGPFDPLPGIELVIDLMPGAQIRFIEHQPPEAEFIDAHELYDDETFTHMIHMAHAFLLNLEIDNGYCGIDHYLSHICESEGQNHPKCIVGAEFDEVSPC